MFCTVLTGHASAYTLPYKLMVFTDKQVYLDYAYLWTNPPTITTATTLDTARGAFNQRVNHARDAGTAHGTSNHNGVVCNVCHWGYQYALGIHGPDNFPMANDPERLLGLLKTGGNQTDSVHRIFINSTLWNGSRVFELEDRVCHQSDGKQPERHTDKKDEAYKAYRCADCHATGGVASVYQPAVYNSAAKISKHYPGSVFLNEMVFTDSVSCSMCHKNRCQRCHGVGGDGPNTMDYGNARNVPVGHNDMGSTSVDCETSCHNSAVDMNNLSIPVDLHNNRWVSMWDQAPAILPDAIHRRRTMVKERGNYENKNEKN